MWVCTHTPPSQPAVVQALLSVSVHAVLSVTLMCALTHWPASQPGVLQLPGTAVTGLPALSTEQAVLSVTEMCWVTHTPASHPGVLQVPGIALTGLPALSAAQAVLSVTLMCARTHSPASQPGVLQLPGMAVTGLPALSAAHGVLSVTFCVTQTPVRVPPVGICSVADGSHSEVRQGVLAGQGTMVVALARPALTTFTRSDGLLCSVPQDEFGWQTPLTGSP